MTTEIDITAVELTVLYATLVDSLDAPGNTDGNVFAFGRDARQIIAKDLWTKLQKKNFKLRIAE